MIGVLFGMGKPQTNQSCVTWWFVDVGILGAGMLRVHFLFTHVKETTVKMVAVSKTVFMLTTY